MKVPRWLRWRSDAELSEEIQAHLEMEIQANLDRGLSPEDARSAAKRRFGSVTAARERAREADPFSRLEILLKDIRYAVRSLLRAPGFTLAALLTLALGIGANTAIFQLFDAVRLRTLPVRDAQELAIVDLADDTGRCCRWLRSGPILTNPIWEEFRDRQDIFQGVLAWADTELRIGSESESPLARGLFVSGEFFNVLGVNPLLGRTFTSADDRPGCGVPGAVLSHDFWQRRFGGDPDIIGRTVALNSHQVPIIGVTSAGFSGLEVGRSYDIAVPICAQQALGAEEGWLDDGMTWWLTVMGRLGPEQRLESANAALAVASPSMFEATLPAGYPAGSVEEYLSFRLRARPGGAGISALRNRYADPLLFLMATTGLVLLLACTNLANLMLARNSAREHELAVRRAIGAAPGRLVRQSMIESGLLALGGAAAGLVLAGALSRFLVGFFGEGLSLDLPVDLRLVAFLAGVATFACLTFGAVPAWRASRPAAVDAIEDGRGSSSGRRGSGLRQALAVSQVALSLVLVFGAVLFTDTLRNLLAVDTGFEPDGVLEVRVDYDALDVPQASRVAFKRDLLDRIARVPGVASAAEVRHVPMGGTGTGIPVCLECADASVQEDWPFNATTEGYLETMGIPLIAGRDFERRDMGAPAAIVNRTFAERLGMDSPVGRTFRAEAFWLEGRPDIVFEIVGYVPDTKYFDLREDPWPIAFIPVGLIPDPPSSTDFMIRSTMPAGTVAAAVRRAIREVNPGIRADIRPFEETIRNRLLPERLMATLAGFFGLLAALVAAVGLYGVIAFLVVQRTTEIGIRMALGATSRSILAMVLARAAKLVGAGCVAGAVLALAGAGLVRSLVFGVEPHSLATIGLAAILLAAVGAAACCIPAARAATVQPRDALRNG